MCCKEKVNVSAVVRLSVTPRSHPVLLKVVFIHALFHQYFDFKCHRTNFRLERQVRFALWLLSRIWSKVQRSGRPGHTVCTYFVCAHVFV